MAEEKTVQVSSDTHQVCMKCKVAHPKDKRYYISKGKGYFSAKCHQCTYDDAMEAGQDMVDPRMGMDREEYAVLVRKEKKAKRDAIKAAQEPAKPKSDNPSPWKTWQPLQSDSPSASASSSVPSEPESEPTTSASPPPSYEKVEKVFDLNPKIIKEKDVTYLAVNDYMKLDPRNFSQRKGPIKSVEVTQAPPPKFSPPPPLPRNEDEEEEEYEDDPDEMHAHYDDQISPGELRHRLVKLVHNHKALSVALNLEPRDVYDLEEEELYRTYDLAIALKSTASTKTTCKYFMGTASYIIEHFTKAKVDPNKVDLHGFTVDVMKNPAIDQTLEEVVEEYGELLEIDPLYRLGGLWFGQGIETNMKNSVARKAARQKMLQANKKPAVSSPE